MAVKLDLRVYHSCKVNEKIISLACAQEKTIPTLLSVILSLIEYKVLPIAYFSSHILPFYLFLFQWRDCDLDFGVVTHLKNHLRGKHLRHYVGLVTNM